MKKLTALLLAALMCVSLLPAYAFAEEGGSGEDAAEAAPYHTEEVIYGVLDADGSVDKLLPVVVIDASEPTELSYHGDFSGVTNLSDTEEIKYSDGEVSLSVPQGRFYFEGELDGTDIPWLIDISYELDGKEISPEALGGKSGALKIKIGIKSNPGADKDFFDSYILQIGITLDSVRCRNIQGTGATIANAGSNKMVNFMAMPGTETNLELSCDAENFSMGGMSIAAVPSSMADMLDGMGGIKEGIDSFGTALNQLSEGVSMLAGGAGDLRDGFAMFSRGLVTLSQNSSALVGASEQIRDGMYQISDMVGAIKNMVPNVDMAQLQFVPGALRSLADIMDYTASAIEASDGTLDEAIKYISELVNQVTDIPEDELLALWAANPDNSALYTLIFNYRLMISMRDVWWDAVESFFGGVGGMSGLSQQLREGAAKAREIADGIESMTGGGSGGDMGQLDAYLDQLIGLGDNYAMFHEGLVQYTGGVDALAEASIPLYGGTDMLAGGTEQLNQGTSQIPGALDGMMGELGGEEFVPRSFLSEKNENVASVQFVFSTQAISAPEVNEEEAAPEEEPTGIKLFFSRLGELFGLSD